MGYGALLLGLSAALWIALAPRGVLRTVLQLGVTLGACATVVGGALGVGLGVRLFEVLGLPSDLLLFRFSTDPARFFYASLGFGVFQLSCGMLLRLGRELARHRWQHAVGALAWVAVLPAVGAWAAGALPAWALAVLAVVLVAFASPDETLARRLGAGVWALYNVASLFGNVASYARIFGLGLSSGVIALVVNRIAMTLADGVLGWLLALLVLVVGHGFNFGMAVIGAVVHPARLQFLEFFATFFEGGGTPYRPLSRGGVR
jgi:V/A-type H+-transporting ATPase subunit I